MTTVGTLTSDLGPGNNRLADISSAPPGNNVPLIITTTADDDKSDKLASAPIDGDGSMGFLAACSKLDMEPNPFEQSFSGSGTAGSAGSSGGGTGETPKPILPPIAAMSGPLAPSAEQFTWNEPSLRMGPLSPSMLEGPQDPIMFEKPATTSALPMGSFPATTAPISTIYTSGAPMADPSYPLVGMPGPSAGPIQTTAPYPSVMYNQQPMSQQPPQHGPPAVARHPQAYPHANGQPPMNSRYMATQGVNAQPADNMNGYGNGSSLHMLNQGPTTTHRETWVKRESIDGTAMFQGQVTHVQQHPSQNGQGMPVMPPGMIAAPQLPKNGVEPVFVRNVQHKRMASEEHHSDDSMTSRNSSGSGGDKPSKKRLASDDKLDDEEKRKNFLERNRQAALKCRQRKKQWLTNLQAKVEYLTSDNEQLLTHTAALRDEIIHLKALLLAHKDCPVAQANGVFPDTISGSNSHAHNGDMVCHGRTSGHSMQGPSRPQNGSRGSLPAQMQTGGARMNGPPGSMVPSSGINGQASVRY